MVMLAISRFIAWPKCAPPSGSHWKALANTRIAMSVSFQLVSLPKVVRKQSKCKDFNLYDDDDVSERATKISQQVIDNNSCSLKQPNRLYIWSSRCSDCATLSVIYDFQSLLSWKAIARELNVAAQGETFPHSISTVWISLPSLVSFRQFRCQVNTQPTQCLTWEIM